MSVDGILELFNRASDGSSTANIDGAAYGRPAFNSNVAYDAWAARVDSACRSEQPCLGTFPGSWEAAKFFA